MIVALISQVARIAPSLLRTILTFHDIEGPAALWTPRLARVLRTCTLAAQKILAMRHWFEVRGIHTGRSTTEMVEF